MTLTVVAQSDKLDVKDAALVLADSADADGIASVGLSVESGLRAVGLLHDDNGLFGGRRASELLGIGNIVTHGLLDLFGAGGRSSLEAQRDASGVAVQNGDSVASGRDLEVALVLETGDFGVDLAENLLGFGFELVFLARDEGDDVVDDVHAADTGVAGARDGLHGDDRDLVDGAELGLQGGKGNDDANDGAVGVADQEALFQTVVFPLVVDDVQVRQVDGGDDQGHEGVAAVVFGV